MILGIKMKIDAPVNHCYQTIESTFKSLSDALNKQIDLVKPAVVKAAESLTNSVNTSLESAKRTWDQYPIHEKKCIAAAVGIATVAGVSVAALTLSTATLPVVVLLDLAFLSALITFNVNLDIEATKKESKKNLELTIEINKRLNHMMEKARKEEAVRAEIHKSINEEINRMMEEEKKKEAAEVIEINKEFNRMMEKKAESYKNGCNRNFSEMSASDILSLRTI